MSLEFPTFEEIPLENSPLAEVIFQIRYPAIWSIGELRPSAFQDRIRHLFPEADEERSIHFNIDANRSPSAPPVEFSNDRSYLFHAENQLSTVSLDTQSVSVSTRAYESWEAFSTVLSLVLDALIDIYGIPYARRIGLRFINVLDQNELHLSSFNEMKSVLKPELLALYSTDAWQTPDEFVSSVFLSEDTLNLMIRAAVRRQNEDFSSILLDFDCFEEGTIHFDDIHTRIDRYHDLIYRAFRWALAENGINFFSPSTSELPSQTP